MTNIPKLAYRKDIDGMRAFAVLFVIAFHAFPGILPGGFIGVDIFFVISGYLISGIIHLDLKNSCFTFRNFYRRRILRIFPALIIVLISTLAAGYLFLLPGELEQLGEHVFAGTIFSENFLLWHETGYFDVEAKSKPLLNLWSLAIEEQFYLLFPLILWFSWRKSVRLAAVVIFFAVISFWDNAYLHRLNPVADFYSPLTRFWELLAGACLSLTGDTCIYGKLWSKANNFFSRLIYEKSSANSGFAVFLTIIGMSLIFIGLIYARPGDAWPSYKAILPVTGTLCLLGAKKNLINSIILENRLSVFIGKISYPLYLWHWPFLSFAYIINGNLDASTRLLRTYIVMAVFIFSVITYLFIEKPIRYKLIFGKLTIPVLLVCISLIASTGMYVKLHGGLPQRNSIQPYLELINGMKLSPRTDEFALKYNNLSQSPFTYLRYKDNGSAETIAVLGDSHAHAAYPGIEKLATANDYNTALYASASMFRRNTPNYNHMASLLELIKNKKEIKKVFLFARGTLYFTKKGVNFRDKNNFDPELIREYKEDLQHVITELHNAGKEIYLIEETPETSINPQDTIKRYPGGFTIKDNYKLTNRADILTSRKEYDDILHDIKYAKVIPTLDEFCPGKDCKMFYGNNIPLYADRTHLSIPGSEWLAEKVLKPYLVHK